MSANMEVPIIDLHQSDEIVIPLIADACRTFGFFQIIHHDMERLMVEFKSAMKDYFSSSPNHEKVRRTLTNARGYFDDELTKQKRDWKECLDIGIPGSRDWTLDDVDPRNACLDGYNTPFPEQERHIRTTIVQYFTACSELADRLARLMAKGLKESKNYSHQYDDDDDDDDEDDEQFLQELKDSHSSYLRLNYYRPCPPEVLQEVEQQQQQKINNHNHDTTNDDPPILGISPHKDAGFLTILLQDESCHSLQVWLEDSKEWMTIHPPTCTTATKENVTLHALTINTGDMCMLWSNGEYRAPLHRVLTHDTKERYSAPFFYNPGYHQTIAPSKSTTLANATRPKYHPCLFGYFRAVRFAGDVTDLGVEIQLADYEIQQEDDNDIDIDAKMNESHHIQTQAKFAKKVNFHQPFSIQAYRPLLLGEEDF